MSKVQLLSACHCRRDPAWLSLLLGLTPICCSDAKYSMRQQLLTDITHEDAAHASNIPAGQVRTADNPEGSELYCYSYAGCVGALATASSIMGGETTKVLARYMLKYYSHQVVRTVVLKGFFAYEIALWIHTIWYVVVAHLAEGPCSVHRRAPSIF